MTEVLKAPFPYFGGKSQIASYVWSRLGDPRNYCEPFAGSLANLLRRPSIGAIETVNDVSCQISNFWRAMKADPASVAEWADWPVIETDLHARHKWLVFSDEARAELARVKSDPEHFNAKIAGWWAWGACCWIGSGWCETHHGVQIPQLSRPQLSRPQGVNGGLAQKIPHVGTTGRGVMRVLALPEKRPFIAHADGSRGGHGVNGVPTLDQKGPCISADGSAFGRGIHGEAKIWEARGSALQTPRHLHALAGAGTCEQRRRWITAWFLRLADRLRSVRVCCGHWSRICDSPSTLVRLGTTGVFLDPPYRHAIDGEENRDKNIYASDREQDADELCDEVQAWCLKWGEDPEIRIVLCGLEGEYPLLEAAGWEVVPWASRGGYGNRTEHGKENAKRERLWVNGSCLKTHAGPLFEEAGGGD